MKEGMNCEGNINVYPANYLSLHSFFTPESLQWSLAKEKQRAVKRVGQGAVDGGRSEL